MILSDLTSVLLTWLLLFLKNISDLFIALDFNIQERTQKFAKGRGYPPTGKKLLAQSLQD
jgi:hypothetical protein